MSAGPVRRRHSPHPFASSEDPSRHREEAALLALLRERNFGFFTFGALVSGVGDYVLSIALPFYVYQLTGSVLATSGIFVAETAPSLLVGPFAGVLVDRWDRRRIKVSADLLRGF